MWLFFSLKIVLIKKTAELLMNEETINSICFLFIVKFSREKMAQRTTLYNGEMTLPSAIFLPWDYIYVKIREKFHFNF